MKIRSLLTIPLMTAVTAILAYLSIPLPFSPVPVTGQTFGVMLAGSLLKKRDAAMSMVLLLLIGFVGLPVFSGGMAGPTPLFGPTGGYLWAMPLSAFLTSWTLEIWQRYFNRLTLLTFVSVHVLFGIMAIYLLGVPWLAWQQNMPLPAAVFAGAVPFLPGDLLKALAASLVAMRLQRLGIGDLRSSDHDNREMNKPAAE